MIKHNLRLKKIGEIDLLTKTRDGRIVILEVRGSQRTKGMVKPSRVISQAKLFRLRRLSAMVQRKYQRPVELRLIEVIGDITWPKWFHPVAWLLIAVVPEWLGIRIRDYRL